MLLSLLTNKTCSTLQLPDRIEGRYCLYDPEDGSELFVITSEADESTVSPEDLLYGRSADKAHWRISEGRYGRLHHGDPVTAASGLLLRVRIRSAMESALLYCEDKDPGYSKYARCMVPDSAEFTVGSFPQCDFVCTSPEVAGRHFVLRCSGGIWSVRDEGSSTGTYVNGNRLGTGFHTLAPGDVVSVMHQKFIPLPGMLSFNAQCLDLNGLKERLKAAGGSAGASLRLMDLPPWTQLAPLRKEDPKPFFHRQPRFTDEIAEERIQVDAPPAPQGQQNDIPALLTYGPAVTSGAAMLLAGMNPVMGAGMLAGSVLFPGLTRKRTEKLQQEEEEKRRQLYSEYITKVEQQLQDLGKQQSKALHEQFPEPLSEMKKVLADPGPLWSRRPAHFDFLRLRLGTGDLPMMADLQFPKEGLSMVDDPMRDLLEQLRDRPRVLHSVPIGLDLRQFYSVGISGREKDRLSYAALLLSQLTLHAGYDDLKLCLIGPLSTSLAPLRWLPHTWSDAGDLHYVAGDKAELDRLVPDLGTLLQSQGTAGDTGIRNAVGKEVVILITDPALAHTGLLTRLLFDRDYQRVHILTLAEHSAELPSRTDAAIGLSGSRARMIWQDDSTRRIQDFAPDHGADAVLPQLVSLMANTFLDLRTESTALPASVPFLDLFGVQDVTHLNLLRRWEHADPIHTLRAPIGIGEDGDLCMLDVHEKGDGPHGLVAGTTGSGKSELLMSYILSMAISYSPEDVSFALIDYKGGGMANAFAGLPHTVGIITNLDGSTLSRSLTSIESENKRRQQLFADVQKKLGLSKVEIRDYQELYRARKVSEPLPHLLIITDEFAELKQQEPEFMQKLISAARIGRSLGVHLLLATQQPAGIVDDQIMTNTSFRLCLRMASDTDSQSILKVPDAASLVYPGSFFKQVGSVLWRGQSGYSGVDYVPQEALLPDQGAEVLDHKGSILHRAVLPRTRTANLGTQLTAVTRYITAVAAREHISARKLWMPVLEEEIPLSSLYERYRIPVDPWMPAPVLGELDDPARQKRAPVRVPLAEGKNTILYGALGSGKVMALTAILSDLFTRHTPDQVQLYILDYGDDGLYTLAAAPHVGDVLTSDDDEKLLRLLTLLETGIERRKKQLGGVLASAPLKDRLQKAGLPNLVILLHQISSICDRLNDLGSEHADRLLRLLKDGPRWGITFLATQETASGLRYKILERFSQRYVLQMDHDDDYSLLLGRTGRRKPASIRGRGLFRDEDVLYDFQVAAADGDIEALSRQLRQDWKGAGAPAIRVMPEHVTPEILADSLQPLYPLRLPVGLDPDSIEPVLYPFDSRTVHLLMGRDDEIRTFLSGLLPLALRGGLSMTVLAPGGGASEDPEQLVKELFAKCREYRALLDAGSKIPGPETLIVLPSLQKLFGQLSEEARNNLRAMLLKARPEWKWTFLLCDTPQAFSSLRYADGDQGWFKASVSTYDALFLGAGLHAQTVLQVTGDGRGFRKERPFPEGYVVEDGIARRIRLLEG